jgi:hypothetical protein
MNKRGRMTKIRLWLKEIKSMHFAQIRTDSPLRVARVARG